MKKSKNVKRTLLSLLTITALCSSGFFMACSDSDDDSGNNGSGTVSQPSADSVTVYTLSADKESVSLYTTDVNKVVAITSNGTAQIKTAPDATIATASITDKSLTITPVAAGSTSIVIEVKEDSSKTLTLPVTVIKDEWVDENTVTLTGTVWWTGSESSAVTKLTANQSVTYTFKVGADGADCLVEAYDSSESAKYFSTTSQKTAWIQGGDFGVTNAGAQELGVLKAGNIYSATISYDGTAITVTYKDLGTDGAGNTELFTTSSTGEVTAPVNAHFAAEFGTFYVKTATTGSTEAPAELQKASAGWTGSRTGSGWWSVFTGAAPYVGGVQVPANTETSATMTITTAQAETNTNSNIVPDVILFSKDGEGNCQEYGVVRVDNFGWGSAIAEGDNTFVGTPKCTLNSDWNWDNFIPYLLGSTVTITVKNYGDGKADICYDCVKDGVKHYQYYKSISVTADNVWFDLTFDGSCSVTFVTE